MKLKKPNKYHTVRAVPQSTNSKVRDRGKIAQIHNCQFSWTGTGI